LRGEIMLSHFFDKPHRIQHWAEAQGYKGTPYDCIMGYFQSNSNFNGTLYDYVKSALNSAGYTGTMADMLAAFFKVQTGVSGRIDSEKAFWDNTSLSFFGSVGILDDSGNKIKDDSGNVIVDDSGN
jgi:hypothetical protein